MHVCLTKMYFDRIDVSEETDVSKAIVSTECDS